jgi:galactokinase/mevalonate kinase-like predicted kinase
MVNLLDAIKGFINSLNPDVIIQAPSRINLINPLDAVEADFWMPSVAINGIVNPLSTFVYVKKIHSRSKILKYNIIETQNKYKFELECEEYLIKQINNLSNHKNSDFLLFYASVYRLFQTNPYYKDAFSAQNIEIGIITTIPKQSGLGGSASIILAFLYAFTQFFDLTHKNSHLRNKDYPINKDTIAEIAAKVEQIDLKIVAGYSDRYIISRGGLCFISYVGKLYQRKIGSEPLAVCDRIDRIYEIKQLPIIICYSGVLHDSGLVHERLRKLYLEKDELIIKRYIELADISWKSRFALMNHDWKLLGDLFQKNTEIMNDVMFHAGFKHGIGLANNFLIELIIEEPEVYAVKLTGAGGGGSVFALVNPKKIEYVYKKWQEKLDEIIKDENTFKSKFPNYPLILRKELKEAQFFKVVIDIFGVKKL